MSAITLPKSEDLIVRQFCFSRNEAGDLIKIPTGPGWHGFLGIHTEQNCYQQIRLLGSNDPGTIATCERIWKSIHEHNDSILFPEIVDFGIEDEVYFYISALPNGEPASQFIEHAAPIPAATVCQLLAGFVSQLRCQKMIRTDQLVIPLASLWIDSQPGGPCIIIGDITPRESDNAEEENVAVCLDLVHRFAGQAFDPTYESLCHVLEQGPRTLANLEINLGYFLNDNSPNSEFWTRQNEPRQILNSLISGQDMGKKIGNHPDAAPIKLKLLPATLLGRFGYLVGIVLIALLASLSINHYYQTQKLKDLQILKLEGKSQTLKLSDDSTFPRQASQVPIPQKIELLSEALATPSFLPMLPPISFNPIQIPLPLTPGNAEPGNESNPPPELIATSEPTTPDRPFVSPDQHASLELSIPEYLAATSEEHFPLHLLIKSHQLLGKETSKDPHQIVNFLRDAVDKGDAGAMDLLGVCHVRGWGVEIDDPKAVNLFRQAIDLGNLSAYYNLGARYAQGQGVARNPSAAADLFQIGAERGHPHCMLVYARCIETGFGRIKSQRRAIAWFKKAAESGNLDALSWCHHEPMVGLETARY